MGTPRRSACPSPATEAVNAWGSAEGSAKVLPPVFGIALTGVGTDPTAVLPPSTEAGWVVAAWEDTQVLGEEAVVSCLLAVPASAWPLTAAAAKGSAAVERGAAAVGVAAVLAAAAVVLTTETLAASAGAAAGMDAGDRPACKLAGMGACLAGALTPLVSAASRGRAAGSGCREEVA